MSAMGQQRKWTSALPTCELKFNLDFYGSTRVSETPLNFFAYAIADGL